MPNVLDRYLVTARPEWDSGAEESGRARRHGPALPPGRLSQPSAPPATQQITEIQRHQPRTADALILYQVQFTHRHRLRGTLPAPWISCCRMLRLVQHHFS
jgi:hypothetical protein